MFFSRMIHIKDMRGGSVKRNSEESKNWIDQTGNLLSSLFKS